MNHSTKPRTVVVTGGAGFIGSHVADGFAEQGDHIVVIDDLSSGIESNVHPNARLETIDICSPEAADLIKREKPQILVHHAAQMDVRRSTDDPIFDASVNVIGTLNLLNAAIDAGVEQVMFASTGGAIYGEQDVFPAAEEHPARPLSPYGVSKLAGERYLYYFHAQYGLDVSCLRYANVYGERQNPHGEAGVVAIFLTRLLQGEAPMINGDGLQTRDYIHVSDVVRANLASAGRSGFHILNVGTGIETSVVDLYQGLCEAAGSDLEAQHGPGKPGEQRRSSVDATRIRTELGLPEPIALDQGLQRTADWFREHN
jgi:UDP-glucose 4-epimerase